MIAGNRKNHGANQPDYYSIIAGQIVGTPGFLKSLLDSPGAALRAALVSAGIRNPPPELITDLIAELDAFLAISFDGSSGADLILTRSQMYLADDPLLEVDVNRPPEAQMI